jgi:hypothetical protein
MINHAAFDTDADYTGEVDGAYISRKLEIRKPSVYELKISLSGVKSRMLCCC